MEKDTKKMIGMVTRIFLLSMAIGVLVLGIAFLLSWIGSIILTIICALLIPYIIALSIVLLMNSDKVFRWISGKEDEEL